MSEKNLFVRGLLLAAATTALAFSPCLFLDRGWLRAVLACGVFLVAVLVSMGFMAEWAGTNEAVRRTEKSP